MEHALAPSTRKMYQANYQKCKDFIEMTLHQTSILPFTAEQIHLYVAYLHSMKYKHSTIVSHLSGISHYHKINQLQDPTTIYPTVKLLAGLRNLQAASPDQRLPITKTILIGLTTVLTACAPSSYEEKMYKSMFTLMYYGCLRASEVLLTDTPQHNLTIDNIDIHPEAQTFLINFTSFKHHFQKQPTIQVASTDGPDCPVKALKAYINIRPNVSGPLYIHHNRPVQRKLFVKTLQDCLRYLNIPTTNYNIHSFPIGRTTDMAQQSIPHDAIQQIGRWKSNAYLKYIRPQHISAQPAAFPSTS